MFFCLFILIYKVFFSPFNLNKRLNVFAAPQIKVTLSSCEYCHVAATLCFVSSTQLDQLHKEATTAITPFIP